MEPGDEGAGVSAALSTWNARITTRTRARWALSSWAGHHELGLLGQDRVGSTRPLTALFRPALRRGAHLLDRGVGITSHDDRAPQHRLLPTCFALGANLIGVAGTAA
jgi:hypothetical protein